MQCIQNGKNQQVPRINTCEGIELTGMVIEELFVCFCIILLSIATSCLLLTFNFYGKGTRQTFIFDGC